MPSRLMLCALIWAIVRVVWAGDYDRLYAPTPVKIYGEVLVTMPQETQRPLKLEDYIPVGAKLNTGEDGELLLALQPGISILLGHKTQAYVSQWKRNPSVQPNEKYTDLNPMPLSSATVTLLRGNLYGMVEKSAAYQRQLEVETGTGLMSCQEGCFALFHTVLNLQAVALFGSLDIDTRFDRFNPNEDYQYTLLAGNTILIARTGELQFRDPESHTLTTISAHYVDDDEGTGDLSIAANAFMEARSNQLVSDACYKTMCLTVGDLLKRQKIKTSLVQVIGDQLTSMLLTRRVDSMVAQTFINNLEDQGINISQVLSLQIHQAMRAPASPSSTSTGETASAGANGKP